MKQQHWLPVFLVPLFFVWACLAGPKNGNTNSAVVVEKKDREISAAVEVEKNDLQSHIIEDNSTKMLKEGRETFRYDTFGSEGFWATTQLHAAIVGEKAGGVGPGLTATDALKVGLKVDAAKLPPALVEAIEKGSVNLGDPATTLTLLKADSVIGVKAFIDRDAERVTGIGITCALCHSTVDDSLAKGIGRRLDGWPNRDLDIGAIIAMAPNLKPFVDLLGVDEVTVKKVLLAWGPGKYDAELDQDGTGFGPDGKTAATLIPAAFGLAGVSLQTYNGWGSIPYWNAYVANTQMHGKGTFIDSRIQENPGQYPVGAKANLGSLRSSPDLVSSKLAALHFYQLAIPAPKPTKNSYDNVAADRGAVVFDGKARCASCHVPPLFTEPGWSMHTGSEIGIDDFQASRSPDRKLYRTTPLSGLFARAKGGFYHDGRFADYRAVVDHYDSHFRLNLSEQEKTDLVEYLKSL